ncbi:MAG: hypothetical protein AAB289_08230 [Chloroflexota bacterium]|mgnify:CR=1 FL=1
MPPIGWHMATAREALRRVGHEPLEEEIGCYLLGATAPDMRVMTGQAREDTHFFRINAGHDQSGVAALFERHPEVLAAKGRPRAFIAGYLTHLTVDETWIAEVYQPYFGEGSQLPDRVEANFMDRVLQFYMEQGARNDPELLQRWYEHIFRADPGEDLAFVDLPSLHRWREVVIRIVSQDPTWEAFQAFILRRFGPEGSATQPALKDLCERIPEVLERTLNHVTPQRVAAYREAAIQRSVAALKEYLA